MHYKAPDNSVHFLDSSEYEYLLPAGSVAITDAEAEALKPVPPPFIPQTVTRFQALAVLAAGGYLPTIRTYIATLDQDDIIRLAWESAAEWERTSPTLNALAQMLGLTDSQVDELFIAASQVSA